MNLDAHAKATLVVPATAAGTTDINGSVIDTQGFDSVWFLASFGALTATQVTTIHAQQSDASDGSGMADLLGTATGPLSDGDSNKALELTVVRSRKRYIRVVVNRGTANAVISGVWAIQYGAASKPTVQDVTTVIASKVLVSPAEGTP